MEGTMSKNWRLSTWLFITALAVFLLSPAVEAQQYFGRNKVQYQKFDFRIIKTKHFDVYYYPEFRGAAEESARLAERWYARISRMLGHELKGRQPLILDSSSPHFQQTTALSGLIGEGTGGVTESLKRRIILPVGSSPYETDHVIGHELAHAFQYDIPSVGGPGGGAGGGVNPGLARVPLWFIEGVGAKPLPRAWVTLKPWPPRFSAFLTSNWARTGTRLTRKPMNRSCSRPSSPTRPAGCC